MCQVMGQGVEGGFGYGVNCDVWYGYVVSQIVVDVDDMFVIGYMYQCFLGGDDYFMDIDVDKCVNVCQCYGFQWIVVGYFGVVDQNVQFVEGLGCMGDGILNCLCVGVVGLYCFVVLIQGFYFIGDCLGFID